ncbi:MAG TPA: thioredoxin family protein, partial [Phycisphaerales bacterium]|nr:thioredoxin family protein [Phycisphaerales bacterium]
VPPGGRVVIAVTMQHAEHWHSWPSVAQNVLPPDIAEFAIRTAVEVVPEESDDPTSAPAPPKWLGKLGTIQWPQPKPALVPDASGGSKPVSMPTYQGRAIIFVPLTIADSAKPGPLQIELTCSYQACNESTCMPPEDAKVSVALSVVSSAAKEAWLDSGKTENAALFAAAPAPNFDPPPPPQSAKPEDSKSIDSKPADAKSAVAPTTAKSDDLRVGAFGLEFTISQTGSILGTILVLLVALLGGFILNLTPCVLPMIPLKILGLTQAAKDPRKSLWLGFVMCSGVVFFWVVIGACIAFVKGFDDVSTLFQLWWFVLGVGLFIGAMAVGMLGLFTVGLPKWVYLVNPSQDTVRGSFVFGIMTAVLATPCIAPFLGTAVAWATNQTRFVTLLAFLAVGTGMALPYLILAANPKWVERVPRSGPASELVKQIMGLLMLAVAAFFIGSAFLSLAADVPYLWLILHWWIAAALTLCASVWLIVRTFQISRSPINRFVFTAVAAALFAGIAWWTIRLTNLESRIHAMELAAAKESEGHGGGGEAKFWGRYTPATYEAARARGDVIVIDFTASWCISCKALKAAVLSREDVEAALKSPGVTSLTADLSSRHDPGWDKLRSLGRKGVPLLAVIGPGNADPWISDAYTPAQVIDAITAARGTVSASASPSSGPAKHEVATRSSSN